LNLIVYIVVVSLQQYIIYQKGEFNKKGDLVMSDETKIINSERIEALEKRVADIEKKLQSKPKFVSEDSDGLSYNNLKCACPNS